MTTKVDEATQEIVDESAEEVGVSRSEILRRLVALLHQSENEALEYPTCTETIRIRLEEGDLVAHEPNDTPTTEITDGGATVQTGHDTPVDETDTVDIASTQNLRSRAAELESVIESQQQEIEYLRDELAAEREVIDDHAVSKVSYDDLAHLKERVEWTSNPVREMVPRVESLTAVSELSSSGTCPACSEELTVEEPFTDLGGPAAVECEDCGLVVGHRQ
ncbi:ribbon-helix-helix protein, CopG family [Salinirubellus sp. GCM10025818]|uniref:ribbon-helix-helix protein, CopG family n=1 Tax=Salinirubellus TaxID=2162630 RepID=UPI0030CE19CB